MKKTDINKSRYLTTVPPPIWTLSDKIKSFLSKKHPTNQKENIEEKIELMLEAETILSRLIEIYTDLSEKYLEKENKENSRLFLELSDHAIEDYQKVHSVITLELGNAKEKNSDNDLLF